MATILDLFEYANDAAARAAYLTNGAYRNLLAEIWDALGTWSDNDNNGGVSSISPAGQLYLDCRALTEPAGTAERRNTISAIGTGNYWIKMRFKGDVWDAAGGLSDGGIQLQVNAETNRLTTYIGNQLDGSTDGIWIRDVDSAEKVLTKTWNNDWNIIEFYIHNNQTDVDIWVNGVLEVTDADCSMATLGDGVVRISGRGTDVGDGEYHIDYLYVGDVISLQCSSEDTIVQQGTNSLKVIAQQTLSLNETLTRTIAPGIDLSGINTLTVWAYASRVGTNISVAIHDSGGTTTTINIVISQANTWTKIEADISGVADANKDDIDSIIIAVINADAINTFYVDNFFGTAVVIFPVAQLNKNRISGYHCFMDQYLRASRAGIEPLKLPDGTIF